MKAGDLTPSELEELFNLEPITVELGWTEAIYLMGDAHRKIRATQALIRKEESSEYGDRDYVDVLRKNVKHRQRMIIKVKQAMEAHRTRVYARLAKEAS